MMATAEYQREWKRRMVARSGTVECACGCGEQVPARRPDGAPRKYGTGHTRKHRPGDTRTDPAGYLHEYAPDHPGAHYGWMRQHRLVWERAYGAVPRGQVVHHINHDRRDNRLENLAVMTNGEHTALHGAEHPVHCSDPEHFENYRPSPRAVLTLPEVLELRDRIRAGEAVQDAAARFGIPAYTATRVRQGQTWPCPVCSKSSDWPRCSECDGWLTHGEDGFECAACGLAF